MSSRTKRKFVDEEDDYSSSDSEQNSDDDFDPMELAAFAEIRKKQMQEEKSSDSQPAKKKQKINNTQGIESKLEEIALPKDWPWIETLNVTCQQPLELENVHDDLKRETEFYQRSLKGVEQAISHLKSQNIPWERPSDYFAEMVKPDSHMQKIKDALLSEKRRMEIIAERKKMQQQRKLSKSIQAEKIKEKQQKKKEINDQTKKLKKMAKHNELNVERSRVPIIDQVLQQEAKEQTAREASRPAKKQDSSSNKKPSNKQQSSSSKKPEPSKKRQQKNSQYGYGGPKKSLQKKNDSKSSKDMKSFSMGKMKKPFKGFSDRKPSNKGSFKGGNKGSFKGSHKGKK